MEGVSGGCGMCPAIPNGHVVGRHILLGGEGRADIVPPILWGAVGRKFLARIAGTRARGIGQAVGCIVSATSGRGIVGDGIEGTL